MFLHQMAHKLLRLIYPFYHTINSDCDVKSRLLGPTLPIVRYERIARSLNLVDTVSRTSPTKGKFLNNTTPPTFINR